MTKKVFISGGSGVIGQELVKILLKKKYQIFVGDLKPIPDNFLNKIEYYHGDLNGIDSKILKNFKPDVFIHLAATFERSDENYTFWDENFQHNIQLSHRLMSTMKDIKSLKRVIFASSYLVYDPDLYLSKEFINRNYSLKETDSLKPRNLTGMAKLSHENELNFLNNFKNSDFTSVYARIFRGYGKNSRDIISRWIRSLINNQEIKLYGKNGRFDFIYSKDTAHGISKLIDNNIIGPVNLGTGISRPISDVIKILKTHFTKLRIKEVKSNIFYESSTANMELFNNKLNWKPKYKLEDAIPEIIEYEKRKTKYKDKLLSFNILITSASKKIPLIDACQRAASRFENKINIMPGDSNINSISKYVSNYFWKMPPTNQKNLEKILNGCKKRKIKIIIPTRDEELYFWSKNIKIFDQNNIKVIVSPLKTIEVCNDKLNFYKFFHGMNISVIKTFTEVEKLNEKINYVVKERYGSSSNNLGINLEKKDVISHSQNLKCPIFQPYIKGQEISIDAWYNNKYKLIGFHSRKREIIEHGESKVTSSYNNDLVDKKIKKFLSKLQFRGPIVVQAIVSKNKVSIIECNARFGGASTASIPAGLDVFYWIISEFLFPNNNLIKFNPIKNKMKQVRIQKDILI